MGRARWDREETGSVVEGRGNGESRVWIEYSRDGGLDLRAY